MAIKKKAAPQRAYSIQDLINEGIAYTPESTEATAAAEPEKRTWGQAVGDTVVQLAEGVNTTLGAVPSIVAPDGATAEFFRDNADYWRNKQSDVLKKRIAATDQRIQEAGKEGVMSQIGTAASEYWNDPAQAARLVATNLPSMAATLGTGALAGAAAKGVAAARGLGAAGEAALAAQYGTRTAMATNAALNAGGARGEAYEDLKRAALAQGMSPEQAEQAALDGSVMPGVVGGVAGAVSGKLGLEKALLGQPGAGAGTALRRAAGAFGAELAGEQIEEVAPKLTTNYEAGKIDPARGLTDDIGRTMVETTIGAGPGAVVAGGVEGMNNPAQTAADAIRANEKVPESGTLTRAVNAGVEAKAQAVEASAQPPALGARLTDTDMGSMLGGGGMTGRVDPLAGALGMNNEAQASSIRNVANVAERRPPMPASDAVRMLDEARNRGLDLAVAEHPAGGFVLIPPTWVTPDMAAQGEARLNETIARMQQADAAPVERAPRTRTDGVGLDLQTDPVQNYLDNLRSVNTPAARAYVRDFDAGRITPADVLQRMQAERGLTPEQRLARAAAEAPAQVDTVAERLRSAAAQGMATPAPTDILNPAGEPFKTRMAADRAAKKTPGAVVPVDGGFVVRPQESVNVQDVPQAPEVPQAAPAVSPPVQATQAVGAQPAGPTAGVPAEGVGAVEAAGVSGEFADLFDEQGRPKFPNAQSVKDFKERTGLGQAGVRAIQAAIQEGRPITVDEARQADLAGQERRKAALEQSKAESEAEAQAAKQNSAKPTEPSKVLGDYEIPGLEGGTNRVRVIQRGGRIEAISLEEGTVSNDLSRLIQSGQTVEQALAALYGDHGPNEAPNPSRVKRAGQPTSAAAPAAAAGLTDGATAENPGAQAAPAAGAQAQTPGNANWAALTPEQRRRARLEHEIATGQTNNGGVVASLRPSAIEKRKQELAAMGDAGKLPSPGPAEPLSADGLAAQGQEAPVTQGAAIQGAAWDALDQQQRTSVLLGAGWRTNKGGLNVIGKRLLNTPWEKISDGTRDIITKNSGQNQAQALDGKAQVATETVAQPPAPPQSAPATHADPGQAPEAATPAVVTDSLKKAARNEDTKPSEMRKWLVGKIDEAIAVAPEAAVDFLSFDVPGDGTFKVQNSQARLQEFRKKVMTSPGFKDGGQKQNTKPLEQVDSAINGSGSTVEAIRDFLADGDVQGAVEFAKLKGVEFTPVEPRASMTANGKFKRVPASVTSKPPSVAEGLTQVEAEQLNQYLTAERARAETAAAQDAVQPSPQDFIPAPASASPESESSQGSSNALDQDASAPPAAPEVKADDVEPKIMQSRPNDWPYANYGWVMVGGGRNAPGAASEKGAKIELSKNPEWKERGAVILPFRWNDGGLRGLSPYADTTTRYAILVRQKESPRIEASSETSTPPAAQPITRADVAAAQQQAAALIAERIDAMTAQDVQKIAARFLPTMGVKVPAGKARIKAAVTDFTKVNPMAAADEFGVTLPDDVRRALDADFEGRVADAGQDDGLAARADGDDDYLRTLFGGSDTAEQDAVSPAQTQKIDAKAAVPMLRKLAQEKRAEAEDWSGRKYKGNKSQVNLRGDGPSNQETMSVSAVNESRRRKAMESLAAQANAADKLADRIESGAINIQSALDNISSAVDSDMRRDGDKPSIGKSRQDMFEGYISSQLLADPYAGYGEGTVSSALRAMYEGRQARADNRKKVETKEDDAGNVVKFSRKGARGITPEQRAENFARWSDNAPLISSEQAEAYDFKTGQKIVVEAFHGSARPDRIGGVFDPKRATSGPMAYFTSSPELASSYATGKADTSLADEDQSYANWFKFKPPGARSAVSIDRAWHFLTPEVQARIRKLAPQIAMDDTGENIVIDPDNTDGLGNYGWELQQARGNPLAALVESWLSSGTLFNEETKFMDVLRMAGFPVAGVEMDFPNAAYPGVFKTYISMKNPLVVGDMPADVRAALEQAAKADRTKAKPGADMWDKRSHTLRDWWAKLNDPDPQTAAYAWTSIPDKVTDVLKAHGYDGIVDWSGKGGGHQSPVYIPFGPTQVKSVFNRGTFDPTKKDISFGRGANAAIGTPAATIRAAITKAYGKLLGQLESKGLVTLTQTQEQAIEAAAQARAAKTGQPVEQARATLRASVKNSVADQTQTENFRRWFADSKVVDADGKPLVVYHGTGGDFNQWGFSRWIWASETPDLASQYAEFRGEQGGNSNVMPLYMKAEAPFNGDALPRSVKVTDFINEVAKQAEAVGKIIEKTAVDNIIRDLQSAARREESGPTYSGYDFWQSADALFGTRGASEIRNFIVRAGFDSITYTENGNKTWGVVENTQIKSATGNNGDFDPANPDIRRSADGSIQGFFDPQTGQSFLIADNLSAEAAPGVLMHEVGIHMAADGSMKALFNRAAMMLKLQKGNPFMKAVQARMDAAGETSGEEAAAYIAEAYENDRANAPASVQRWLTDLLAAVKAWMFKKGIMGADRLTVADIAAVARANARSMARDGGATGGQGFGPAFSHAPAGDQTQTENFRRWFGDSRVVDADGKPLVVYHGTHSSFTEFKPNDALGGGMFFSPSPEEAGAFTGATGSNIMPVYLSAQKVWPKIVRSYDEVKAIRAAKSKGYDAIRVRDDQNGVVNWVVFDPTQVKSAIGNNGDFDPSNPDIRFSRATEAAKAAGDAIKSVTVTNIKKKAGFKLTDYLGIGLQALGRRQIVDIYGDLLPLAEYNRLVQQMEADKNEGGAEADQLVTRWAKLPDEAKLADLMHDATLAQIDPDKPYVDGDDKAKFMMLERKFKLLSDDAKAVYRETRDAYKAHHAQVRSAIKERIERSEIKGERKAALLKQMDDEFFKAVKGVYFPLARFGQYAVTVKGPDGKVESVSRAETKAEAEALRNNLLSAFPRDKGFTVGRVMLSKDFIADRDAVGRGFMTELYQVLDKQDMDAAQRAELEDTLGQLYLSSLPDLSWAKHGIHRKGTPGFSQDARRAFAQNMFHGARYLAKLRYSDLMQDELAAMQKHVDDWREVEDFDQNSAQRVVDEMNKRHESLMNPASNPLSTALTSLGFVFHLGLSPASAMVNLSQTALVAYPIMGAKWGFGKASAALLKASAEAAKGKNDITGSLNADERAAYDEAVRAGTIDVTMAHDLAGIAQGEDAGVMWKIRPVMRWASFFFHHAERFNRQVTFVAAYRLAREAGADHKTAFEQATKATYDGHFDYGAANRPRIMQGNVAKVLLLFKQYGQNMVYTLARNAQQAIKGESPEVRSQARKALGGLLATHAAAAGVLGLPMVTTLLAAASMIGGDDDEPWDAKVALQNMLADTLGQKPAEVLAHGLSRLTPWDISGRVGLDRLIFPDVQEGLEGQRLGEAAMAAALGPVAGIGINVLKGLQDMSQGQYARGLEAMLPAALRGPVKAIRYESEGVQDKTGVVIQDDVSLAGVAGQFLGFSPSEVRNATEGKSAVIQQDRALGERRQELLTKAARATMAKDAEARAEAMKEIERFNQKNPTRRITPLNVLQSVRNRQKRIDQAEGGVYLPKNRRDAMEAGRFAVVD